MRTKLVAQLTPEDLGQHVRVTFAGHRGTVIEGRLLAIHVEARTERVWEHAIPHTIADLPRHAELTVDTMTGHVPLSSTIEVMT